MRTAARVALLCLVLAGGQATLLGLARPIPTPESVLGFKPGADNRLATYDQSIAYLKQLAAASPSLKLIEAGKTTRGRTMYFALVSAPANLARIDRLREIARRLAHPGAMTDAEARSLAREGKAFVHIDGGCHATEVAGPQMIPQLAYDLLTRTTDPAVKDILANDVVMLWPTMNPDGQQMVGEWLAKNAGTPYEQSSLPELYQDYVGHDNNRDGYMVNMIESRVLEHFWRQWEPNIIYVLHQVAPFPTRIWLPPFSEPVGLHAPPVISREINMIGMAIAQGLDAHGQPGATHMGTSFDAWYPGYVDYAPAFKNIPAFWTETAGNMAAPREYSVNDLPAAYRDLRPQSLYASPWPAGWWRLADAVGYDETAAISTLEYAAKYKDSLLYNRYQAGRDQVAKGKSTAPYAWVIPQAQRDPVAAVELLRRLAFGGVRVEQLGAEAAIDGGSYAAGTWVVPADQEFAAIAREVLDVQKYPDLRQYPGGPPLRPYDAAGWTLPLQMGVDVVYVNRPLGDDVRAKLSVLGGGPAAIVRPSPYNVAAVADPAPFDSVPGIGFNSSAAAAAIVPPPGRITGTGPALVLDPAQNNTYRALNAAWKQGASVAFARATAGGAAARFTVSGLGETAQADLAKTLALSAERGPAAGAPVRKPRVGLFQPWGGSMDEGWTRWILERFDFDVMVLHPEDFKTPIGDRVDVLIIADDARVPTQAGGGATRSDAGMRGAAAAGTPSAPSGVAQPPASGGRGGARVVRPEYAYALTQADLQGLEAFVQGGGTVVCLNGATRFAIQQFKLPVKNVAEGLRPDDFFLRGSIVEVRPDTTHPVMAGMPAKAAVFVDGSPVFETLPEFSGTVLARYADTGSPLLSGYLIGEKYLQGKAAALDVNVGQGHVVLIGFRPQWRAQSFGTFRVVFNAAMFGRQGTSARE
jgi:hypothetical protein